MKAIEFQPFDVLKAPLEGSNMIEASAGTGKTYSLAILLLRILLEQKATLDQVLMVTFTNEAVAELETRARLFIRKAIQVAKGKTCTDKTIQQLVEQHIAEKGQAEVKEILRVAHLWMDELQVLTINGFCQKILQEYAFETQQVSSITVLPDTAEMDSLAFNKIWRSQVTTLPLEILNAAGDGLSRDRLLGLWKAHASGKHLLGYDASKTYEADEKWYEPALANLNNFELGQEKKRQEILKVLNDSFKKYLSTALNNSFGKGWFADVKNADEMLWALKDNINKKNIEKIFDAELLLQVKEWMASESFNLYNDLLPFYYHMLQQMEHDITSNKTSANLITYDDQINYVHEALMKSNGQALIQQLNKKYRAVFIDEFQDTNRKQYEIFSRLFLGRSILFFIGDPKQSIYAFRSADVFAYLASRNEVDRVYTMNTNYRSVPILVDSLNKFFKERVDRSTFGFPGKEITYIPVEAKARLDSAIEPSRTCVPIHLEVGKNKSQLMRLLTDRVLWLLKGDQFITQRDERRAIQKSDLGILVYSKKDGVQIQQSLNARGVNAIVKSDQTILETDEAQWFSYLLEAVVNRTVPAIHKALFTPIFGFTLEEMAMLKDDALMPLFENYYNSWNAEGLFSMIRMLQSDFDLEKKLVGDAENYQAKTLANLNQLVELVFQAQRLNDFTPADTYRWLLKNFSQARSESDELRQRLESDEDAVQISTIHSSKGLEYPIVLCYNLSGSDYKRGDWMNYRNPNDGKYYCGLKSELKKQEENWYKEQSNQERMRLIYVALTRAIYEVYLFQSTGTKSAVKIEDYYGSEVCNLVKADENLRYKNVLIENQVYDSFQPVFFQPLHENWRRMSYSSLAVRNEYQPLPRHIHEIDSYDEFVFQTLEAGATTGDLLHFIFEKINFSQDKNWKRIIAQAVERYARHQVGNYEQGLNKMLQWVVQNNLVVEGKSFQLKDIPSNKLIAELEFEFPVSRLSVRKLNALSEEDMHIAAQLPGELRWAEGVINGKVDLFFEMDEKFYVLDWKSNYLGYLPEHYERESLVAAMNHHNYHLQYLIYTLAIKKHITQRLGSFNYEKQFGGVIYLFVRGMREGNNAGVFFTKPNAHLLSKLEALMSHS